MKPSTLPFIALVSVTLIQPALAQQTDERARDSFGLGLGYSLPTGEWTQHRYASGVNHFSPAFAMNADLEFNIGQRWGLALVGGYNKLGTNDWVSYTKRQNDPVEASASVLYGGATLRPTIMKLSNHALRLEFGACMVFASGTETYGGMSYDYDFLRTWRFGLILGLEYSCMVSDAIALTLQGRSIFAIKGIEYADGLSPSMIIVPITGGLRMYY